MAANAPIADVLTIKQVGPMTDARKLLVVLLRRVADGGDVGDTELDTAVSDPLQLDPLERDAWEELSHWADDGDIRDSDARYAAFKRERMRNHIAALMSSSS